MNWDSFLSFIRNSASNEVKFFGSKCKSDDFGAILTAFANTKGGYIVIGFDNNNYHLTGTDLSPEWVNNLVKSYCVPKIEFECFQVEKNDKKILIVNISQNYEKPYFFNDKCYVLNTQNSKLSVMEKEVIDGAPKVLKNNITTASSINVNPTKPSLNAIDLEQTKKNITTTSTEVKTEAEELEDLTKELLNLTNDLPNEDVNLPFFNDNSNNNPDRKEIHKNDKLTSTQEAEKINVEETVQPSGIAGRLNDRQEKTLVYLTKNSFIKNKKYRELYDVSHKTAHLELIDLVNKKLIKSQGSGRSTCYVINMPVQQQII